MIPFGERVALAPLALCLLELVVESVFRVHLYSSYFPVLLLLLESRPQL